MKKIIDDKGKLFGAVSIIDLAVVLVIVVLALSTGVKYTNTDEHIKADKSIEYNVTIYSVRQPTVDAFKKQLEDFIEPDTEKELGDIIDIKVKPAKTAIALTDGTIKEVEYDNSYDIFLTLKTPGTETKTNYYTASGKKLVVGDSISMTNDIARSTGTIMDIKVVEE